MTPVQLFLSEKYVLQCVCTHTHACVDVCARTHGENMLLGNICMEKIIILWSDCEGCGGNCTFFPIAQPTLNLIKLLGEQLYTLSLLHRCVCL